MRHRRSHVGYTEDTDDGDHRTPGSPPMQDASGRAPTAKRRTKMSTRVAVYTYMPFTCDDIALLAKIARIKQQWITPSQWCRTFTEPSDTDDTDLSDADRQLLVAQNRVAESVRKQDERRVVGEARSIAAVGRLGRIGRAIALAAVIPRSIPELQMFRDTLSTPSIRVPNPPSDRRVQRAQKTIVVQRLRALIGEPGLDADNDISDAGCAEIAELMATPAPSNHVLASKYRDVESAFLDAYRRAHMASCTNMRAVLVGIPRVAFIRHVIDAENASTAPGTGDCNIDDDDDDDGTGAGTLNAKEAYPHVEIPVPELPHLSSAPATAGGNVGYDSCLMM